MLLATAMAATRAASSAFSARPWPRRPVVARRDARRGVELVRELVVLAARLDPGGGSPVAAHRREGRPELEGACARDSAAGQGATLVVHEEAPGARGRRRRRRRGAVHRADHGDRRRARTSRGSRSVMRGGGSWRRPRVCALRAESEDGGLRGAPRPPTGPYPELREGDPVEIASPSDLRRPRATSGASSTFTPTGATGTAPDPHDGPRRPSRSGYRYVGISDHSRAAAYANGLDGARLAEQGSGDRASRAARRPGARSSTASRSTSSPTARSIFRTTSSAPSTSSSRACTRDCRCLRTR